MDIGSADAAEHWANGTMVLHVAPADMAATARGVDRVADKIQTWLDTYSGRLGFKTMGYDEVSRSIASRLSQSAYDPSFGLVPMLWLAVRNLRETAASLRDGAERYRQADEANAGGFAS